MFQIIVGAGGAGEVQNCVQIARHIDEVADILIDEAESFMPHQMGDIVHVAGDEVVHADDGMPLFNEAVTEM